LIDLKIKHLLFELAAKNPCQRNRIHAFSCLFYAKIMEGKTAQDRHDLVAKWTKNINLFELDFILFPINQSNHWSLVVLARPNLLLDLPEQFKEEVVEEEEEEEEAQIDEIVEKIDCSDESVSKHITRLSSENRPCFLHLDSLSMHPTKGICKTLLEYIFYERAVRMKPTPLQQLSSMPSTSPIQETSDPVQIESKESVENVADNDHKKMEVDEEVPNLNSDKNDDELFMEEDFKGSEIITSPNNRRKLKRSGRGKKTTNKSIVGESLLEFEHFVPSISCAVPKQLNGCDCGVFVIRFAEMIINKLPTTNHRDIAERLKSQFAAEFTQEDIYHERKRLKELLESLRPEWSKKYAEWRAKNPSEKKEGVEIDDSIVIESANKENQDIGVFTQEKNLSVAEYMILNRERVDSPVLRIRSNEMEVTITGDETEKVETSYLSDEKNKNEEDSELPSSSRRYLLHEEEALANTINSIPSKSNRQSRQTFGEVFSPSSSAATKILATSASPVVHSIHDNSEKKFDAVFLNLIQTSPNHPSSEKNEEEIITNDEKVDDDAENDNFTKNNEVVTSSHRKSKRNMQETSINTDESPSPHGGSKRRKSSRNK
jgi:hypothetical protein